MAKLSSESTTIEITPFEQETPTSNWIDTIIAIEYHILGQNIRFELPSKGVSLTDKDFDRLINGARTYVETLPGSFASIGENSPVYHFSPIEIGFDLTLDSGFYFDENRQDGVVYVTFMMALRGYGVESLIHDKIGCTVGVAIRALLRFLAELEEEIQELYSLR